MGIRFNREHYLNELVASKHNGMIKIITGLRRSGKSYLLFTLFREHLLLSGVDLDHIIGISLDNIRFKKLRNPEECANYIDRHITDDRQHYVLIDEIQLMPEFEDVLNSYVGRSNVDVYVTGSNSHLLVNDVITEFRGRGDEIRLYPLSITEIAEAFPEKSWETLWAEYSRFGGLPQVVLTDGEEKKAKYLKQLFRTTYFRDIIDRYNIKQVEEFGVLIDLLASAIGSLTNPLKLQNTFVSKGYKLSNVTISQYLRYLQDAFMIEEAKRYDIRGKQYIGSPFKYYFTDNGLRNVRLNFRQYEETHIMENAIYIELLRRGCEVDVGVVEVVETRGGKKEHKRYEVDFVANRGSERFYIQSAFAVPDEGKMRQEERSLLKIYDSFKKIIVVQSNTIKWYNNNGTLIISLREFLTEENSLNM